MRLVISGFRHGHVAAIVKAAQRLPYVDIVACVEPDPQAREAAAQSLGVKFTHDSLQQVLESVDFDALACVDTYARRGPQVIAALQAGKHVATDKPLCIRREELLQIAALARDKSLCVHVDLTMRYSPLASRFAKLVRAGAIGALASATVLGHHALSWGSRPQWYFEEGQHGGTINDIMIHGIDLLRWATGREHEKVLAAAAGPVPGSPAPAHFQQSAQCWLQMEGGARVYADASYLAPAGHHAPWRFLLWGAEGHISYEAGRRLELQRHGEPAQVWEPDGAAALDPFEDFARQVELGEAPFLSREECLRSTLAALVAQEAADHCLRDLPIPRI
jgi:predicted dehydrogenase